MNCRIDLNSVIKAVEEKEQSAAEAYKKELLTCKSLHGIGYHKGKLQAFHDVVELLQEMLEDEAI